MGKLVRVNIYKIIERLTPVFQSREKVVAAYLFGSVLEPCRPDSDIDIGLLLAPDIIYSEKDVEKIQEDILEELPPLGKHSYDLVILNCVSAIFAYRVITEGKLIYTCDYEAVTDFMEKVSRQRAENYLRYRQALEAIVKG